MLCRRTHEGCASRGQLLSNALVFVMVYGLFGADQEKKLRRKLELAQKQKDEIQLTVENFENSSKNISKLIDCQIVDKYKTVLGYNAVPPPYTGNFMPLKPDLSFSGLEEFTSEPIVIKHVAENSEAKASESKPKAVRKNNGAPFIEDWVSDNKEDDVPQAKIEKKTFNPSFAKIEFVKPKLQEKTARKTINHVKQNRQNIHTPRGNHRNWINMMSQRLGSNFERFNKAFYVCGSFDHLQRVNTIKDKNVNTVRPKAVVNVARPKPVVNDVKGNNVNVVKASAYWVWKPKTKVLDHGNPQMDLQDQGVIDSGCSRNMTGNMSYLTNFEEIDEGYVTFGGNLKGRKITGIGRFNGKADEGFFVGYSINSKAFRVFNSRTRIVEENLHVKFSENTPNITRNRPNWLFDIDGLTKSMNYKLVVAGNQSNGNASTKACDDASKARRETSSPNAGFKPSGDNEKKVTKEPGKEGGDPSNKNDSVNSTNNINTASDGNSTNNVNTIGISRVLFFMVYEEEVYVCNHQDLKTGFPNKVYKVKKQCELTFFLGFFTAVKTASTPMETQKLLLKDKDGEEVDVHLYRSIIGSLMYLISSRPDIMFVVYAYTRYQVNPKVSHLYAVKRIFRYLKGQPKLGLWYPKDSPFDLVAYTDSDYARASLDRKSTTGGCQFLGSRLISWQCKKQTVVANSITKAEYVAASSCCGQVLWIQNQLLDYGHNLLLLLKVNAARHNLLLLLKVNDARHKLTTAVES
ncbi:hypothetical protein Tco_0296179 [Tanacetum coccineum]